MSLVLAQGTKPKGLRVKTWGEGVGMGDSVHLGDYEISIQDFLAMTEYVLGNTDLVPDDPRYEFIRRVRSMEKVEGHAGPGSERLSTEYPPRTLY